MLLLIDIYDIKVHSIPTEKSEFLNIERSISGYFKFFSVNINTTNRMIAITKAAIIILLPYPTVSPAISE